MPTLRLVRKAARVDAAAAEEIRREEERVRKISALTGNVPVTAAAAEAVEAAGGAKEEGEGRGLVGAGSQSGPVRGGGSRGGGGGGGGAIAARDDSHV